MKQVIVIFIAVLAILVSLSLNTQSALEIDGGKFSVEGTVVVDNLRVASDAELCGTGTIEGDTHISGIVSPGEGVEDAATLTFGGDLAFEVGSVFMCYAASHTDLDKLLASGSVSGSATILMTRDTGAIPLDQTIIDGNDGSAFGGFVPGGSEAEDWRLTPASGGRLLATHLAGDSDADGIPDFWEDENFSSRTGCVASVDSDGDTIDNEGEYIAQTDPWDSDSIFRILSIESISNQTVVSWTGAVGRLYSIERCPDLNTGDFSVLATDLPPGQPLNTYTDSVTDAELRFYRIEVYLEE